ncbi:MAG: hypothetical protein HZB85_10235 [Deltaproteobacteria bacterium]|nr:hypothetical protein [Deltaproteobacteria bacterium]
MKRLTEITMSLLTVLILRLPEAYAQGTATTQNKNLRSELIENQTIELVYPIDDHYTFVAGQAPALNLDKAGVTLVSNTGSPNGTLRYVIIKNEKAEPFVYTNRLIGVYDEVAAPANGTFNLSSFGSERGRAAGYSAMDLFEEMTALCRKTSGTPVYVVPVSYGINKRMTKVSAVDAFSYVINSGSNNSAWFMACDGPSRFVVEKEYRFAANAPESASFYSDRLLENVNYVTDGTTVRRRQARILSAEESDTILRETALEVAQMKTGFVKAVDGSRFTGTYEASATDTRCANVSVKYAAATIGSETQLATTIYDFKVCDNRVARLGQRMEKDSRTLNAYATTMIEPLAR